MQVSVAHRGRPWSFCSNNDSHGNRITTSKCGKINSSIHAVCRLCTSHMWKHNDFSGFCARLNCEFAVNDEAQAPLVTRENTTISPWGSGQSHLNVQSSWRPGAFYIRRVTQRFLRVWVTWPNIAFELTVLLLGQHHALSSSFETSPRFLRGAGLAAVTCEFTLDMKPKTHCTWENTAISKSLNGRAHGHVTVNFLSKWSLGALKHEIYPRSAGRASTLQSTVKTKPRRFFHAKTQAISPGLAVTCTYTSRKFIIKMKPRRILHEKTQRFLPGLVADWGGGLNLQSGTCRAHWRSGEHENTRACYISSWFGWRGVN